MQRLILVLAALTVLSVPARSQDAWPGSYPEGPAWIGGTLYWAEMRADRVMQWTGPGEQPRVFIEKPGCGPTAIARYRENDLAVLCHLSASVLHVDSAGAIQAAFVRAEDGIALRNPNDVSADGQGGVWFSDPGTFAKGAPAEGALYHLAPDGRLTRHAEGLAYGNGVHVDRAGQRLLVSEHLARRVLVYPLTASGLGPMEVLFNIDDFDIPQPKYYPEAGPDGLEIGPEGTLWVAEYGATRLLGWRADKGLVAAFQVDAQFVTNIAFGPDGLGAMTGVYDNVNPPFRGAVWVFDTEALTGLVEQER